MKWTLSFSVMFLILLCGSNAISEQPVRIVLSCSSTNDLIRVLRDNGIACSRYATPEQAVQAAPDGSGLLLLADCYPEETLQIPLDLYTKAEQKKLKLYVEYASVVPEFSVGLPKDAQNERGVVASDIFGAQLRASNIFAIHGCRYLPMETSRPHLVLAKVAGVDTAVFGWADTLAIPILFEHPKGNLLVATTKLSHFVTGRYMPTKSWQIIWKTILKRLGYEAPKLEWTPTVHPAYGPNDPLPKKAETRALRRSADWLTKSRILRHPEWPKEILERSTRYNTVRDKPKADWPLGNGSLGLLEGYSSTIRGDGSQPMRYAVRHDNMSEVAMLLGWDARIHGRSRHAQLARNLLGYVFNGSGFYKGTRSDPSHPAFGLASWSLDGLESFWGDDNARAMLSLGTTSALLNDPRWNAFLARCMIANLRTTGTNGFREECVRESDLQKRGWESYWNASPVKLSPHFESWLWACFFWAYQQTHFPPLLERSKTGISQMMKAYPDKWDWCIRSGSIERARFLLPLAWLVRVEDTPEHRQWLRRIASDLIELQDACGAIREIIGNGGHGTASNSEYGTRETSLIQNNGDPVCDMLYTCNFGLLGLHEAAAATGEDFYAKAEDRLAQFLCRIQIKSKQHPELDGAWYRAFHYQRWEYWASNADWEWGPWCTESGWTQPWIAGTLALRHKNISLWELLKKVDLKEDFNRWRPQMLPDRVIVQTNFLQK